MDEFTLPKYGCQVSRQPLEPDRQPPPRRFQPGPHSQPGSHVDWQFSHLAHSGQTLCTVMHAALAWPNVLWQSKQGKQTNNVYGSVRDRPPLARIWTGTYETGTT